MKLVPKLFFLHSGSDDYSAIWACTLTDDSDCKIKLVEAYQDNTLDNSDLFQYLGGDMLDLVYLDEDYAKKYKDRVEIIFVDIDEY